MHTQATKRGTWTSNSVCVTEAGLRDGLIPRCISRDLKWGTYVYV